MNTPTQILNYGNEDGAEASAIVKRQNGSRVGPPTEDDPEPQFDMSVYVIANGINWRRLTALLSAVSENVSIICNDKGVECERGRWLGASIDESSSGGDTDPSDIDQPCGDDMGSGD